MKVLTDIEYVADIEKSSAGKLIIGVRSIKGNCSIWLETKFDSPLLANFQILEKKLRNAYANDNVVKIPREDECASELI